MAVENPSGFLRLFIALSVSPAVRREIGRVQGRLRRLSPPGAIRWTRPEQFHVTLKFLGDVPVEQVAGVENATSAVCANSPALQLSARGIGFFPSERKPRVIWTGAKDDLGQLAELHRHLDEALHWLAPTERPESYTGHITLGRFKPGHPAANLKLVELAADFRARHFGDWPAGAVEIVRSDLTSTGATHTMIAAFKLAA